MKKLKLTGLVAATHTPFGADGSLNLAVVESQAKHLLQNNIQTVFIGGSTGENHSLSLQERIELTHRWIEVVRGTTLKLVVHVGSNCLGDAKALATQAGQMRAHAISALAPCYFKPRTLESLIQWCTQIAEAAPETPFYYYDIPTMTGVHFSMVNFLAQAADCIPTLAGIKFTNYDLMGYQLCVRVNKGMFDIPWGADEALLAGFSMGAQGGIGTTYNFAAPIYHRLIRSFHCGDLVTARQEQFRAVQLIQLLAPYGLLGATKSVMNMLGVDVGPARAPHSNPTIEQTAKLRCELERLGFFDWILPAT